MPFGERSPSQATSIAVTGADGFIGRNLCSKVEERGFPVVRIVRRAEGLGSDRRVAANLESVVDARSLLQGTAVVVHLAGRAHVLRETETDPYAAFQRANVDATLLLARGALQAGVGRFVFVSSIGVNGNETHGKPFTEVDEPAPVEAYALSKLHAEQRLKAFCAQSGIELVIVRPPLVYGPSAAGNFGRLLKLAASGLPLPIGGIRNRRNLIGVENLSEFLLTCAVHPGAAGQTFLAAEPEVRSTPELITSLARALGRRARIFSVPLGLLRTCVGVVGKRSEFDKLCASLEISPDKARSVLGWSPTISFDEQIGKIARAYREGRHNG